MHIGNNLFFVLRVYFHAKGEHLHIVSNGQTVLYDNQQLLERMFFHLFKFYRIVYRNSMTLACFSLLSITFTYWLQYFRCWITIFTFSTASFMDIWEVRYQFNDTRIVKQSTITDGTKSYWSAVCWQISVLKAKRAKRTNAEPNTVTQMHDRQCQTQHY